MLNVFLNKVNVTKEGNEITILQENIFELEEGNIYTIVGKNGTGKSTLLRSLTGLLDKRFYSVEGKVLFEGKDILTLPGNELRQMRQNEFKYVFQDPVNSFDHLKSFGYYFNFLLRNGANIRAEELLKFFLLPDLKVLSKMYPYEVSGGMAQRISFILALLAKPKIIFLDEPTSGVDAPIVNLLLIKLREFVNKGNIALMVTQDLYLAKNASSKIALLSEGILSKFVFPGEFFKLNPFLIEV